MGGGTRRREGWPTSVPDDDPEGREEVEGWAERRPLSS